MTDKPNGEFRPGDLVDITIKGARVDEYDHPDLSVEYSEAEFSLDLIICDSVTVERVAPAEWPPRTGDLWRDEKGMLYLALQDWGQGVDLVDIGGETVPPDEVLFRKPTLVHREGAQS